MVEWWEAGPALVSAGAAIVSTGAAYFSIQTARQANDAQLRPRIRIGQVWVEGGHGYEKLIGSHAHVNIVNIGRSPTTILSSFCQFYCSTHLPMKRPIDGKTTSKFVTGRSLKPGENITGYSTAHSPTSDDISKVINGESTLWIMGHVQYTDKKMKRRTMFCSAFDVRKNRFFPIEDMSYELEH